MTKQHRATDDEWAVVERANQRPMPSIPWSTASCLLELRDRIQQLEATHPTASTVMSRIKLQKFSKNGETFWQLRCKDKDTGMQYAYQIVRGSVELIKHPNFYNDRRAGVARDILAARQRLRDLVQSPTHA